MTSALHSVLISVGTNYQRVVNAQRALAMLAQTFDLMRVSYWYVSLAVGMDAAPYWNSVVTIQTRLDAHSIKAHLRLIEDRTGRVRRDPSGAKSKQVSLDLDILIFDGDVLEPNLFHWPHVVVPFADLHPDWVDVETQHTARWIAQQHMEAVYRLPNIVLTPTPKA